MIELNGLKYEFWDKEDKSDPGYPGLEIWLEKSPGGHYDHESVSFEIESNPFEAVNIEHLVVHPSIHGPRHYFIMAGTLDFGTLKQPVMICHGCYC